MKKLHRWLLLCLLIRNVLLAADPFIPEASPALHPISDQRVSELKSLRFGMFICWSFSTFSGKEWTPGVTNLDLFNPSGCDAEQWVKTAKAAEMGYILFLAKHHDGFCLWDTKTTDRKVTRSLLGRDVLRELREACDRHGIKLALYFSEGEWAWPDPANGKRRNGGGDNSAMKQAQLRELLTEYGPIEYVWFDYAVGDGGLSHAETIRFVKSLQPNCFVGFNNGDQQGADIRLGEMGRPGALADHAAAGPHMDQAAASTYRLAEFTYPILPPHEGGAMWFYSLPRHDQLCLPAEKIYEDYLGAVRFGNIFSLDVGPNQAGRLRDVDVQTLHKVGQFIRGELKPAPTEIESRAAAAKKLIEYGWDVPTPAQMSHDLAVMQKRPFDGVIFRLGGGHNAFATNILDSASFAEDAKILRELQFTKFTDNFVLIWGSPPAGFDWFDDSQWAAIEANAKLLVRIAQAGQVKGICFDPEPYDFSLWHYAKQPGTNAHSFAEYQDKIRERGAQLMHAFEQEMPAAIILTFFHVSLFDRFATLSEEERVRRLARESWGLMPDFFVGMLEAASPRVRFIDGNENAYYYTSREQYFRGYHAIRQRARNLIPSELRKNYDRQVEAGQALYVDHNFALRQPNTEKYLSFRMTPEERAQWFEHNTYWALYTTDEYVWCYSERMNWWKDETPAGLEAAIVSARRKITEGKPLGFEIEPIIAGAGKR